MAHRLCLSLNCRLATHKEEEKDSGFRVSGVSPFGKEDVGPPKSRLLPSVVCFGGVFVSCQERRCACHVLVRNLISHNVSVDEF